jgi:RNA polymerase sigma-70 factor (ECF subfamily)
MTELERRSKRVLPHEFAPPAVADTPPGAPQTETTWIEPYPSVGMGFAPGRVNPEARYEQREGLELAFVAALQHLAATQRAMLILREVIGFSASEVATMLRTTVPSVNSGVQRARAAVRDRIGPSTQQRTLRSLGDADLQRLVNRYIEAWEGNDVDAFTALLVEDATFAMPPLATWYTPRETIASWARMWSLSGAWRWKPVLTEANAQPALAFYSWDEPTAAYLPFALNVLSFRDGLVSDVTAFIVRTIDAPEPEAYQSFPKQPLNQRQVGIAFARFGMPDRLT